MAINIAVYIDWDGLPEPYRLGLLHASRGAGREIFDFEFDPAALSNSNLKGFQLDPQIGSFLGRQFPAHGRDIFGVFSDSSPDRWGCLLMRRRLERDKRRGLVRPDVQLLESDYLLGVHDMFRVGALRFRLDDAGNFLDDQDDIAAPPFVHLRKLEAASLALERDEDNTSTHGDEWLSMLIALGGSLGGARPKASVVDPEGHLWIAKFPSLVDDYDVGAWEMVVHALALRCGLRIPNAQVRRFSNPNKYQTFLVKRFDRTAGGQRLHFASAMTLTGYEDGDDASTGASYIDLARVLIDHGAQTDSDLRELWSRIVFNLLVSNSDDHLRNHGFLFVPGEGWRLSEAYDMNPVPYAYGLKLNISEADNAMDLELVRSVAHYFRLTAAAADEIISSSKVVVKQWRTIAGAVGLSTREQKNMASAFRLAE